MEGGTDLALLEAINNSLTIPASLPFSPICTTPNRLEMYVRICVERIFSLFLFAH